MKKYQPPVTKAVDPKAARIDALIVEINNRMRKKGGGSLEVRAVRDPARGKLFIRTDLVEPDGTRVKRQESPESTPDEAITYLEKMKKALG